VTGIALDALDTPGRPHPAEPPWRHLARAAATDWLAAHAMPTRHDEAWRYAPAKELVDLLGVAVVPRSSFVLASGQVDVMAGDHGGPRLVFVNGVFAPGPSHLPGAEGVTARHLADLGPDAAPGPVVEADRLDGFVARNAVAAADGAAITVAAGATPSEPVHIVHVAVPDLDTRLLTHPQSVIRIEAGARATIIESYVGFTGAALTNAASVIEVHDGAALAYHRVQSEAPGASHVGHVRIRAGQDSVVRCSSFSIGAQISRVAFDISLVGDRAQLDVDGLYVPAGDERHDHVITAEHLGSHTRSNQRFKGVIDDRARGSFTGQVIVREGTIDTVADQTNHSLVLTATAESDTRPWLEILADDVQCTHGATIGRLGDDALFYLRSRGIPEPEARRVLIDGFTSEIVEAVAVETLRAHLTARMLAKQRRPKVQP